MKKLGTGSEAVPLSGEFTAVRPSVNTPHVLQLFNKDTMWPRPHRLRKRQPHREQRSEREHADSLHQDEQEPVPQVSHDMERVSERLFRYRNYCFHAGFTTPEVIESLQSFAVRESDVFVVTYPKSGQREDL